MKITGDELRLEYKQADFIVLERGKFLCEAVGHTPSSRPDGAAMILPVLAEVCQVPASTQVLIEQPARRKTLVKQRRKNLKV